MEGNETIGDRSEFVAKSHNVSQILETFDSLLQYDETPVTYVSYILRDNVETEIDQQPLSVRIK